jgi:hypothetical protein
LWPLFSTGPPDGLERRERGGVELALHFSMRFDFRNRAFAKTAMADRYAAALEMAEWAEANGCAGIGVAEHHGAEDGYIPSPVVASPQ